MLYPKRTTQSNLPVGCLRVAHSPEREDMQDPVIRGPIWRLTPLAVFLALMGVVLVGSSFVLARRAKNASALAQKEIDQTVKGASDFHARIARIESETRELLDPLIFLLEIDRKLIANGLPPLSAKDFASMLAEENRKLIRSGASRYIDTCKQLAETEKHLLYQGLRGPVEEAPGWTNAWKTECPSMLREPLDSVGIGKPGSG
jgi:hypothetical protein